VRRTGSFFSLALISASSLLAVRPHIWSRSALAENGSINKRENAASKTITSGTPVYWATKESTTAR
jgi:hypothetical protein